MNFRFSVLIIFLVVKTLALAQDNKLNDYTLLITGDTIRNKIYAIKKYTLIIESYNSKGKVKKRMIPADSIKMFYSKDFKTIFESHYDAKDQRNFLIGIFDNREIIIFGYLKAIMEPGGYSGGNYDGPTPSSFFALVEGTYFRHVTESNIVLHPYTKEEIENIVGLKCPEIMKKVLSSLSGLNPFMDLRGALVKYNDECDAKQREEQFERNNNKR